MNRGVLAVAHEWFTIEEEQPDVELSSDSRMGPEFMESVSYRRPRIVLAAQRNWQQALVSLNHHLERNWLAEPCRRVRKDAAPGVDGQTVAKLWRNWLVLCSR